MHHSKKSDSDARRIAREQRIANKIQQAKQEREQNNQQQNNNNTNNNTNNINNNNNNTTTNNKRSTVSSTISHDSSTNSSSILQSKQSISQSRQTIDDQRLVSINSVNDIAIERDYSESQRRLKEHSSRRERLEKITSELSEHTKQNNNIEQEWRKVALKQIPQELYESIATQYRIASTLLNSKDDLIKKLQTLLRGKDEDYVELLSQHADDINNIVKQMKTYFLQFVLTCKTELINIEKVFLQERSTLIEQNRLEIEILFEKRRRLNLSLMESKQQREKRFAIELDDIRSRDSEDYNALKVDLEQSIAIFEQQLEQMRATYQLNTEKLEYNHSVLMERDLENKHTVEQHRKKLRRLKEQLSHLTQKFLKQDEEFKNDNVKLTNEYKRLTDQFQSLQKKFALFVFVDHKKYEEIWEMNEMTVLSLCQELLKADRSIHLQILGLAWKPPLNDVIASDDTNQFKIEDLTSTQLFHKTLNINEQQNNNKRKVSQKINENTNNNQNNNNNDNNTSNTTNTNDTTNNTINNDKTNKSTTNNKTINKSRFTTEQMENVMSLVLNEISFLADPLLPTTTGALNRIDAILHTLGIEEYDDFEEFISMFYDDTNTTTPTVHPNDVNKLIKQFMTVHQHQLSHSSNDTQTTTQSSSTTSQTTEKKQLNFLRKRPSEKQFWLNLGNIIDQHTTTVWIHLEQWQIKYNTLLEERSHLINQTTNLSKENEQLKLLLQEYTSAGINHELQIPPTQLIRVRPQQQTTTRNSR